MIHIKRENLESLKLHSFGHGIVNMNTNCHVTRASEEKNYTSILMNWWENILLAKIRGWASLNGFPFFVRQAEW